MLTGCSGQFNPQTSDNVLTGCWQGPITTDRMRPVTLNPYWNLTVLDRTLNPQGPVRTDRTRPVTNSLLWNLTRVDRTLPSASGHLTTPASGRTERSPLIK